MRQITIYKITNPAGQHYIGRTVDYKFRMYRHELCAKESQPLLHASYKKYGFDNHTKEILAICKGEEANELERFFIDKYKSFCDFGFGGLNQTTGGVSNCKFSKACTDKLKANAATYWKGKKMTDEHIRKSALARINLRGKAVIQFDKKGNEIKRFLSCKEAERLTGISNQHISSCSKGKLKTAGGYIWKTVTTTI